VATILSIEFSVKEAYRELMASSGMLVSTIERKNGNFLTVCKKPIDLLAMTESNEFKDAGIDEDYNYCLEITNGQRSYLAIKTKDNSFIYDAEKRDDFMKLKSVTAAINKAFDENGVFWDYLDIPVRTELDQLQKSKDYIDTLLSEILHDKFFKEISENVMQIMKNKDNS